MIGVTACADAFAPSFVPNAQPFQPPAIYADWWREVEQCSRKSGRYERVRWHRIPDAHEFEYRGGEYNGYWWPSHDIVLAGVFVDVKAVVTHEMLHDIMDSGDHPLEYFVNRCGNVVSNW